MASDEKRILLVEDEKTIRDAVAAYLERENYIVRGVGDGQSALEEFEKHSFDLIILDLMLPKLSGERVCRAIRETSNVPIIMLTAKGEVEDRIIGLELGADDYLIKPFSPRELVARVRALLRRAHAESEPQPEVLDFGDLVIDISGHKVMVEGKEVDLTASEFKLLTTLARYPGRVYTRMELVLRQFRHISFHTGMLNGQTALATGKFPMWVSQADKYVDDGILFGRYRKGQITK